MRHFQSLPLAVATVIISLIGATVVSAMLSAQAPTGPGPNAGEDANIPSCSISTQPDDIVVTFPQNASKYLTAHNENRATMEATSITGGEIPPGNYRVILESYDNHDGSTPVAGSNHDQQHEQWQAQLFSDGNTLIAESNAVGDIPDADQSISETVNTNLEITESIEKVIAKHAFYPSENPESHYPICAVFRATTLVPTCEKPHNVTTTTACNLDTGQGTASANWSKVDAAIRGYEYQLSTAPNFQTAHQIGTGIIEQPYGAVLPGLQYSATHPPSVYLRTRSLCSAPAKSNWTAWKKITFSPPRCGGPIPTPEPDPRYSVTVNLRVTDNQQCVPTKPLLSGNFSGRVHVNPLEAGTNSFDVAFSSPTKVLENLQGSYILNPRFSDFHNGDDTPPYTNALGPTCPTQKTISGPGEVDFYFTPIQGAWWQSSFGDIFGNSVVSRIPPTAIHKYLSLDDTASDAGVVLAKTQLELGTGLPNTRGYQVQNQLVPAPEDVTYFRNKLQGKFSPASDINSLARAGFYRVSGHQTLSTPLHIAGDKKIVVLIDGPQAQLTVAQPIEADPNAFILFLVDGPITFAGNVTKVRGIFIATQDITISGSQQAFMGYGSFISTQGNIVSRRSLPGSDNNTLPSTTFVYDPGLVVATPRELRTTTTSWQEIEP